MRSGRADRVYDVALAAIALVLPLLLGIIAIAMVVTAWPAFHHAGFSILTSDVWDPERGRFGLLPAFLGTIGTAAIAVILASPLALGVGMFLTDYAPLWLRRPVAFLVDLLAAIPTVVYGLWGIFVLVPFMRMHFAPFLKGLPLIGGLSILSGTAYGPSVLTAGLLLAIMILPFVAAVTREILAAVPRATRDAAFALGATRWEVLRDAVLPAAWRGIAGAILLGLARAIGETMAVTMVIGNRMELTPSLLSPGYTLPALIANEFAEARGDLHLSALMAAGVLLLATTLVVTGVARWLARRVGQQESVA